MSVQVPVFSQTTSMPPKASAQVKQNVGDGFDVKKFTDNFDALVDAVGGISAMRRLVLELAIRGRFTSSRPIAAKDTGSPFPIPDDWDWGCGQDLFTFVTSGSRGWARYYADKGPLFLRIGNLDYETIALDLSSVQRVQPPKGAEGLRTRVIPGDVLISITGDTGMVGLAPSTLEEAYINQHIALARPCTKVIPKFIARALTAPSLLGRLQSAQRGIKNSLGLDDIRRLKVPVPPLAEQERIAAKVDQLMALCDELQARQSSKRAIGTRLTKSTLEALTTADSPEEFDAAWQRSIANFDVLIDRQEKVADLRKTLRDLAVSGRLLKPQGTSAEESFRTDGPFAIPSRWEWCSLGALATQTDYGTSQKAHEEPTGVAILRMNNIQDGRLDLSSLKYVPPDTEKLDQLMLSNGDLLFNRTNSYELVGKMAVFCESEPYTFASYLIRIRLNRQLAVPEYINLYFASGVCRRTQLEPHITRQTNQANFNGTKLKDVAIPTPPVSEQMAIVARVEQLMKTCDALEVQLRQSERYAALASEAVANGLLE